jgi:deoxyadenosine/deoxycytidine kinase
VDILRQRMPEARWIEEPVSEWQNLSGKNINMLEKYYMEPKRWGFTFQIYAIFTRVQKLHEAALRHPDKVKISERSVLADKYVFSELMKDLGYMNEAEHEVFKSLYRSFEVMAEVDRTKLIYLKCTPEKCHQRTKSRMRPEETEISLDYLKLIHDKHEKWFKGFPQERVLVIDTSEDFKENPDKIADFLEKIKRFME